MKVLETPALLLSRTPYGDADLIVHLFTEEMGHTTSLARGARRSKKRYVGALEPMHTLRVSLGEPGRGEFVPLRDAHLARPRTRLVSNLEAMSVAGQALRWIRRAAPPRTPEPTVFTAAISFLDRLDEAGTPPELQGSLAAFGVRMLASFGWALELTRCISCERICPQNKPALLSPERGGLVCRRCGGGALRIEPSTRHQMLIASEGKLQATDESETSVVLRVVERALSAHMGIG